MKLKTLLVAFSLGAFAISLNSCKKNNTADEFETTFELSGDQAIADNFTQDANDVFNEAAVDKNVMGNFGPAPSENIILSCATVTIVPLVGFPKNISIDFGTGCTSPNGVTRKGKINIVLSDSVRRPGSTAVMTFDNYYVSNYKIEGTYTWTNTSAQGVVSWHRKTENGKVTAPDGRYWLHYGDRDVTMTAGSSTYTLLDDVYSITGNHTVTNAAGATRTATVLTALQKKYACANIDKGTVKIQGPNHYAVIDFGDGTCDNLATVSIDGRTPRTITLR